MSPIALQLEYQTAVNRAMANDPKPRGQMGALSEAELVAMDEAYAAGVPVLDFVAMVRAWRVQAVAA